jgi:hypothetical protein
VRRLHHWAAVQVQPSYTRISNASNWNFDYLKIHHTKIEEANAEGMYIGYFTDEERNTGYAPYRMGQVLIYRDTVINSGWDAMQVACADEFEIHDNYVDKASLGGKRSHSSFISWNSGNKVGYCYRNTFRNAAHAASIFFGRTGKEAYLYSNLLIEGTYPDSIIAPAFIYSRLENTYQDIGLYIFHNTIITERMPVKTAYINKYDDRGITVVFAGNAIQMNQKYGRNFPEIELEKTMRDSASWIIRNEWRMSSKTKELKWDKSYRPAKDSPLIGSHFDIQKNFPNLKGGHYDRDGYPLFVDGKGYTYGCYSGYPLFSKTTQ